MLMLTRTHRREMAAKDAEVGMLADEVLMWAARAGEAELALAKFTGPRERGQGGRFVKGGGK